MKLYYTNSSAANGGLSGIASTFTGSVSLLYEITPDTTAFWIYTDIGKLVTATPFLSENFQKFSTLRINAVIMQIVEDSYN